MKTPNPTGVTETTPPPAPKLSLRPVYTALTLIFGILLGAGGLFAYQEYIAAPEAATYEECIKARGSIIQESYPATCVTRDGKRFTQLLNNDTLPDNPVSTYTSPQAHVVLSLPKAMYVTDSVINEDGWQLGSIVVSTRPGGNEAITNLTIVYGIPAIGGKGGACVGEDGKTLWQKKTILKNTINVCDTEEGLHAGYLTHPTEKIEYAFFIGGNKLTTEDMTIYRQILYEGLAFAPSSVFPMETFTCPKTEWVDCMPGPTEGIKLECTSDFLSWAKTNCQDFQGAAY